MRHIAPAAFIATCLIVMGSLAAQEAQKAALPESDPKAKAESTAAPAKTDADGQKTASPNETKGKQITLARLTLRDAFPEGPSQPGLLGELQPRLQDVVKRLDRVAKDDKIKGLVLALRNPELGMGQVEELRTAITRLRKSGKKVYADLEFGTNRDYLIATSCDEIVMPPAGMLMVTGLRAELTFFKGLLEKLGVQADFMQIGDFKGAAEPFTRTHMSPEFRKQFEAVIDDYYDQMVKHIAHDRKLDEGEVKKLIDQGILTAERAKQSKLIDRVCYEEELGEQLKKEFAVEKVVFDRDYGKKQADADFSGIGGFFKLLEAMAGDDKEKKTSGNKIALVYAVGPITGGKSATGLFGNEIMGSDTMVEALRKAEQNDQVKAIVLRVDSPGGSALASDLIWREIVEAKKPVVVSMGNVAASGGYYISMGADKIFAEPGTLTGSIGVVTGKFAIGGLLNRIGVTTDVISRGQNSGLLSPTEPMSDSQRKAWLETMQDIYNQFTTKAAQGRKLDRAKIDSLAGGRLFTGRMAAGNGLVDKVGTLDDAIAEAKSMAGLKAEDKVDLLILPKPKTFFEQLFESPSLESETRALVKPLVAPLGGLEVFQRLLREPVLTILPYQIEIR